MLCVLCMRSLYTRTPRFVNFTLRATLFSTWQNVLLTEEVCFNWKMSGSPLTCLREFNATDLQRAAGRFARRVDTSCIGTPVALLMELEEYVTFLHLINPGYYHCCSDPDINSLPPPQALLMLLRYQA